MKKREKIRKSTVIALQMIAVVFLIFSLASCGNTKAESSSEDIETFECTVKIDCTKAAESLSNHPEYEEVVPEDGIILAETTVEAKSGDTVYEVLENVCESKNITLATRGTGKAIYVEGIGGLCEKDFGEQSGWMYVVGGEVELEGIDSREAESGDEIVLFYTLERGKDLDR